MEPLYITAFLDPSPGHRKQTLGIIKALAELTHTKTELIYIKKRFSPIPASSSKRCDIAIGTGSMTHLPILFYKKKYGAKAITCMTPGFLKSRFDLCFVPMHDYWKPKKNMFVTIGPPNISCYTEDKNEKKGLIVIGGIDKKSHIWNGSDICKNVNSIVTKKKDVEWTISSSPRTPDNTENMLKNIASNSSNADFIEFSKTKEGWIEAWYVRSHYVWLTADSVSMVYEALTAGCKVGILPVKWKKKENKFQKGIDYLTNEKLVSTYEIFSDSVYDINTKKIRLDEASRCAKEILERWWNQKLK